MHLSASIDLASVVIDCPDGATLAAFYAEIVDGRASAPLPGWGSVDLPAGGRLDFQSVPAYRPPTWPGLPPTTQMHLDFHVEDLDAAEERVLAAGASKSRYQPHHSQRIYLDPAGHPFCLSLAS